MSEKVACPLCPDSFERESAKDARGAVTAHMAASTDEQHEGVGYQKADQLLSLEGDDVVEQSSEQTSKQSPEQSSEQSESSSSEQRGPAFDGPAPDRDRLDEDPGDVDDSPECPHCGASFENADQLVDDEPVRGNCSACGDPVVIRP